MLRPIKNSQLNPRLTTFKIANDASSAATAPLCGADISVAYTDAAQTQVTLVDQLQRGSVPVATASDDSPSGGYVCLDKAVNATDKTGFQLRSVVAAGTDDTEATVATGFVLGWDSQFTDAFRKDTAIVNATTPKTRAIGFRVAAGAITRGKRDGTIVTNSTGNYTITFRRAFSNATPIAAVSVESATGGSVKIVSVTSQAITVKTFNTSNSAAAISFHMIVVGSEVRGTCRGGRRPLSSSQVAPRMIGCYVLNTAGTPTLATGSVDATIVDNGTGDYTITFRKPFKRAPIIVGIGDLSRFTLKSDPSASAVTVVTRGPTHTATDKDCSFIVLGFDSKDET